MKFVDLLPQFNYLFVVYKPVVGITLGMYDLIKVNFSDWKLIIGSNTSHVFT